MRSLLIAVPMHGYSVGVLRILSWVRHSPLLRGLDWRVLIFDDESPKEDVAEVKAYIDELPDRMSLEPVTRGEKLRFAFQHAGRVADLGNMDAVLTCESDAVPYDSTLEAMIRVFDDPLGGWVQPGPERYRSRWKGGSKPLENQPPQVPERFGEMISVSPIYKWNNILCYPSQPTWLHVSEDSHDCYQLQDHEQVGLIGMTQAVPFLFTLWKPFALRKIGFDMPTLMRLDTALGIRLWNEGYIHLRLLDHSIGHFGGGMQSRK